VKNLFTSLLGRFVTLTSDTTNRPYVIVAIWLEEFPVVALEALNSFHRPVGGPLVIVDLGQCSTI
jgi:hypothetical protein